jgi:hypothetical protein
VEDEEDRLKRRRVELDRVRDRWRRMAVPPAKDGTMMEDENEEDAEVSLACIKHWDKL